MTSLEIRRPTRDEMPAVGALAAKMVRFHHGLDPQRYMLVEPVEPGYERFLRGELRDKEAVLLVAVEGGAIVAYAYGRIEERDWMRLLDRHGHFHDLYVEEHARRRGIARALSQRMLDELAALGATQIVLDISVHNEPSRRLVESLGFRPTMTEMTKEVG